MSRRVCVLVSLLGLFGWSQATSAVEIDVSTTDDGTTYALISGEFLAGEKTDDFASKVSARHVTSVTFNSPGGNVYSAMAFGRAIRLMGLATLQGRSLECASACTLAFLGGAKRWAMPGSLGVHQHSFSNSDALGGGDAVVMSQMVTADVLDYLDEMGVESGLLKLSLRYEPNDMRYLSASEMTALKVTTSDTSAPPPPAAQGSQAAPSVASAPAQPDDPVSAPSSSRVESNAVGFVNEVISFHSEYPAAALRGVVARYAGTVNYFGKVVDLSQVIADKRAYFQRWPQRSYIVRPETVAVVCERSLCQVTGVMDWQVSSAKRQRRARGSAAFHYSVDTSAGMRIVGEDTATLHD